jgi:hypothetical protein
MDSTERKKRKIEESKGLHISSSDFVEYMKRNVKLAESM